MPLTKPAPPPAVTGEDGEPLIKWSEEWKTLAGAKSLVVLHVRERLEDRDFGNGPIPGFSVDVLFASGPRKGQVHHDVWVLSKGMTSSLLREKVGAEVSYRLDLIPGSGGRSAYPQANEPSDVEFEAIERVYREGWFAQPNGKAATYSGGQAADADQAPF